MTAGISPPISFKSPSHEVFSDQLFKIQTSASCPTLPILVTAFLQSKYHLLTYLFYYLSCLYSSPPLKSTSIKARISVIPPPPQLYQKYPED